MISRITSRIFLGEFSDVVDSNGGNPRLRSEALDSFGINCILNIMEDGNGVVVEGRLMLSQLKYSYVWSPVPVDCAGCADYANSAVCDDCLKKPGLKNSKFIKGLDQACTKLSHILSRDGENVLVHCIAGMDRSPFVVAKYLSDKVKIVPKLSTDKSKALDFIDVGSMSKAYAFIKLSRPFICEHLEWIWWEDGETKKKNYKRMFHKLLDEDLKMNKPHHPRDVAKR